MGAKKFPKILPKWPTVCIFEAHFLTKMQLFQRHDAHQYKEIKHK